MSLKSNLNNLIKEKGYITYQEMIEYCVENGYKTSNAERRLRHSESPNVKAIMGKKKSGGYAIIGYQWLSDEIEDDIMVEIVKELASQSQPQLFNTRKSFE